MRPDRGSHSFQWLHVLLGILWFGFALSMHFIISPALAEMPNAQQQKTTFRVGEIGEKVFPVVGILIMLLGIIRGTLLGPIDSFGVIFTCMILMRFGV